MDEQSVSLLSFNRVNYILSVAGAISAADCNSRIFFICIASKFMKFQWTLICLHWFILTADLWNFNFLFILRLLEMESLSDNWLQWMEMIWSVLKQMRSALRGFAVRFFKLTWFEFFLYICMHLFDPLNTGTYSGYSVEQRHDLRISLDAEWHWEDIHALFLHYVYSRLCWTSASLGLLPLNRHKCWEGFSPIPWQVTNAITLEWTSACAVYLSPPSNSHSTSNLC